MASFLPNRDLAKKVDREAVSIRRPGLLGMFESRPSAKEAIARGCDASGIAEHEPLHGQLQSALLSGLPDIVVRLAPLHRYLTASAFAPNRFIGSQP